jgi:hypothetical protein
MIHLGADNRIPLIVKTKKSIIYIAEIKSRVKKIYPPGKLSLKIVTFKVLELIQESSTNLKN